MIKVEYSEPKSIKIDDLAVHRDNFLRDVDRESQKVFEEAIAIQGVKVPISITREKNSQGKYEILNGARRFRAAKKAGHKTIQCELVLSELTDPVRAQVMVAENGFAKDYTPENRKKVILIWFSKDEILSDDRGGAYGNQYSGRKEFKTPIRKKIMDLFGWPLGTVNRDLAELRSELKEESKKPLTELPDLQEGEITYFNNRVLDWYEGEKQKDKIKADARKAMDEYNARIGKINKKQGEFKRDFKKVGGFENYLVLAVKKDPAIKGNKELKKYIELKVLKKEE